MSWMEKLAQFAQQLLKLQDRVEQNTDEILELRREMKELISFTQKVAVAVKATQQEVRHNQEMNEREHRHLEQALAKQLEIELLKLDMRLNTSNMRVIDGCAQPPKSLPSQNGRVGGE